MKKDFLKLSILVIVAFVVVGGLFLYTPTLTSTPPTTELLPQTRSQTISLSVQDLYNEKLVPITEKETALAVLERLSAEDSDVMLKTKDYAGMGTLVESIGVHKNGEDKKYWQYKVNGVMPQIGAGAYELMPGDKVEWFFENSQQ